MKIHEYQAKALLRKFGVPVPRGEAAFSVEEAEKIARELGSDKVVVKAQIHAGGRGKGGGVKLADSVEEAKKLAGEILGMTLVTHQTGPEGKEVKRLLVEEGLDIAQELYLGILVDRAASRPLVMLSAAGGMEIEKVAAETPELIIKEHVDPATGLVPFQARKLAFALDLDKKAAGNLAKVILKLYKVFTATDASMVEINPLVITGENEVVALDAKLSFDDNAMFRHKDILEYRDLEEEEPLEIEASKYNLNYIKLDGTVGCMVNGAGLAMATMDIIKLAGGSPANFLDVGGTANAETVSSAFGIITADPNVKAVLINIFGGIVRCDRVARGVIEGLSSMEGELPPMVIRLEGTNAEEAKKILEESDLSFEVAGSLAEAAEMVVKVSA
jgi:succinyl-CoA synthetase beta subunit